MKRLYLFTLEIAQLEVSKVYDELPSHLTLMSRFLSGLAPLTLAARVRPFFRERAPVHLIFDKTTTLGPKKVTAHMVRSLDEQRLHNDLCSLLDTTGVEYQYLEFIGNGHSPHVTQRKGMQFAPGSKHVTSVVYLIEVIDKKRVVRAKFKLGSV